MNYLTLYRLDHYDRRIFVKRVLLMLFFAVFILGQSVGTVKGNEVEWQTPALVTDQFSLVRYYEITSDWQGNLHVFWINGDPDPRNLIYHTSYIDGRWTEPIDIVALPDWDTLQELSVFRDNENRLHLSWTSTQGIYYSNAFAEKANNASNWRQPLLVASGNNMGKSNIIVDHDGVIHLVYSRRLPGQNVLYIKSEDIGYAWSLPYEVSSISFGDEQAPDFAQIAVDGQNNLHVVWTENYPPSFVGQQLFHRSLTANEAEWGQTMELSELDIAGWNASPSFVIDSNDNLHIVWACGESPPKRCYTKSEDAGVSWLSPSLLFFPLVGLSFSDTIVADPYGSVYFGSALRSPQGFYFSHWSNGVWLDPPKLLVGEASFGSLGRTHSPRMTITEGNKLHIVMVESVAGPLWYVQGKTHHPTLSISSHTISAGSEFPDVDSSLINSIETQETTTTLSDQARPTMTWADASPPEPRPNQFTSLILSAFAVIILILTVVISKGVLSNSR